MMKCLYAALVYLISASMVWGQGFQLNIPRGPSWQSYYDNAPDCRHLIGDAPLSIFGIEAQQKYPGAPGLTVTDVVSGGPSAEVVQPGDLLISINGAAIVRTRRGETSPVSNLFDGYNFDRGVYIFGYRNSQPLELLLLPCGKVETVYPFGGSDLFGKIYSNIRQGVNAPREFMIAGFARGKAAGRSLSTGYNNNPYVVQQHYCWIKEYSDLDITRTSSEVTSSGARLNERKTQYSYSVDLALAENVRNNFEATHNEASILTRDFELTVSRLLSSNGCANPEWKGFERKIYALAGRDWDYAKNQAINWTEMGLAPPNN